MATRFASIQRCVGWAAQLALWLASAGCGGEVVAPAAGGSSGSAGAGGAGGLGGTGAGASGAGAADAGGTPCSAPDWEGCGIPDCPEGRPGCIYCYAANEPGLVSMCAESLIGESASRPRDGMIILTMGSSFATPPLIWHQVPFSAGVIVANHGQAERLGYADRGKWTGDPIPQPTECPSLKDVHTCGGYCGGCPVGEICTGRSPLHPYGLCIRTNAGICSLVPEVNGSTCESGERCFVFTVEPEHQIAADAEGFCMPKAECEATAATLPGGGRCE
jgi:hypothetical protein